MPSPDQRPDDPTLPPRGGGGGDAPPPSAQMPAATDKDRALAALHNFAKPQPKANVAGDTADLRAESSASGASGFVGMLAKGQLGSGDSHVPPAGHPPGNPSAKSRYPLHMAREVASERPPPPTPPTPGGAKAQAAAVTPRRPTPARPVKPVSGWYRVLLPVIALTALLLLLIGLWAAGALIYMAAVTPTEPAEARYPLLHWSFTAGEAGDFTRTSRLMAWSMLACLPLSIVLGITAVMMRRRIARRPQAKSSAGKRV